MTDGGRILSASIERLLRRRDEPKQAAVKQKRKRRV